MDEQSDLVEIVPPRRRLGRRAHRHRREQIRRRVILLTTLALMSIGTGMTVWYLLRGHHAPAAQVQRFVDGSEVIPLSPDAELVAAVANVDRTVIRLENGAARFQVVAQRNRLFWVETVGCTVEVLPQGAGFLIGREDKNRFRVSVSRGEVNVLCGRTQQLVGQGQSALFPPESPKLGLDDAMVGKLPKPLSEPSHDAGSPHFERHANWRALAVESRFAEAYHQLKQESLAIEALESPAELLLAADVFRMSLHPDEAELPLKLLLERFPEDARAAVAAFSLGRLFSEGNHNDYRRAAGYFAMVNKLVPGSSMVDDASVREIEAWMHAGDRPMARRRAEEFAQGHPSSERASEMLNLTTSH